jgi:molecular chaperone GrpE
MNGWTDVERPPGEHGPGEHGPGEHGPGEHGPGEHGPGEHAGDAADEGLLQQLRDWLVQTRAEAAAARPDDADEPDVPAAGLIDVVAAFTALRHEVKLETRSARDLREQSESLLSALQEAMRRFDSVQADEAKAARQASGPLAESLAELDETLERGLAALEQARRGALDRCPPELQELLEGHYRQLPWWRRWAARPFFNSIQHAWTEHATLSQRALWDSLGEGYRLMQGRLRRSLENHGIHRIPTVGRPVDPHAMTVIEAVDSPGGLPGTVAEELRPGYRWNGRILRFAEVRAVRAATTAPGDSAQRAESADD